MPGPGPAGGPGRFDPGQHVRGRGPRLAPAEVAVLAHDDLVERARRECAVHLLVVVPAVARDAEDADRPARAFATLVPGAVPFDRRRSGRTSAAESTIIRLTKSARWRIPSTLWQ